MPPEKAAFLRFEWFKFQFIALLDEVLRRGSALGSLSEGAGKNL